MSLQFELQPTTLEDVPSIVRLSHAAFATDKHSLFKAHEKGGTVADELQGQDGIAAYVANPKVRMIKAVLTATSGPSGTADAAADGTAAEDGTGAGQVGEMIGFTHWAMWPAPFDDPALGEAIKAKEVELADKHTPLSAPVLPPTRPADPPIDYLGALTYEHLLELQVRLNAASLPAPVLYCLGITVSPAYQARGVGSALIADVVAYADAHGASCWIHLSDHMGGKMALERYGFIQVAELCVDLDQYARKTREDGEKWGSYTFHYMRREARR